MLSLRDTRHAGDMRTMFIMVMPQPTISWKVVTHYATSLTKSRNFCYVMLVVYRTYLIGFTRSQKVVTRCGTSAKVVDQMPPE